MQMNEPSFGIKLYFFGNFTLRNKYIPKDTRSIKIFVLTLLSRFKDRYTNGFSLDNLLLGY